MPVTVNVGTSRKVGQPNYGSLGADCHITFEVDSALIDQPDELKAKIRKAYVLATSAVAEELARQTPPPPAGRDDPGDDEPADDRDDRRPAYRNGSSSSNGSGYRKERHEWGRGGPGSAGTRTQERPRRDERRSGGGGRDGVPRSGKELFGWLKDRQEEGHEGLLDAITRWGKKEGFGYRINEWSRDEVGEAHTQALRWMDGEDRD